MKKIIIISLCLLFANITKGQVYIPFPTDSASWVYYTYSNPHKDLLPQSNLLGDTLIKGLVFQKYGNPISGYVTCYFHVDDKKVYWLHNNINNHNINDTTIRLLYDFDLNIGDSIFYPNFDLVTTENNYIYVLDSIDYFQTNIDVRKRFNFKIINTNMPQSSFGGTYWIEGIGEPHAVDFISNQYYVLNIIEGSRNLICFFHNNQHVYGTDCTVKVDEFVLNDNLLVYPNPFVDNIQMIIPEDFSPVGCSIYDINGKIIKSESISEFDKTITINANTFKKGTYFIVLSDVNGKTMRKVVVKQ